MRETIKRYSCDRCLAFVKDETYLTIVKVDNGRYADLCPECYKYYIKMWNHFLEPRLGEEPFRVNTDLQIGGMFLHEQ